MIDMECKTFIYCYDVSLKNLVRVNVSLIHTKNTLEGRKEGLKLLITAITDIHMSRAGHKRTPARVCLGPRSVFSNHNTKVTLIIPGLQYYVISLMVIPKDLRTSNLVTKIVYRLRWPWTSHYLEGVK